jgi:hypothetical protein
VGLLLLGALVNWYGIREAVPTAQRAEPTSEGPATAS